MLSVVIIDDERIEREGIAYLLGQIGQPFHLREAKNGQEGLDWLAKEPFDIVIVDIRMPVMGGLAFLESATALYPRTKYIIYSAHGDFEYAREAISLNVVDYMLKPIREEDFFATMAKVIRQVTQEKREEKRDIISRAIRGLNRADEQVDLLPDSGRGMALLIYFEKPVLDEHYGSFEALMGEVLPQAQLFIENEQECYLVMTEEPQDLMAKLEELAKIIHQRFLSPCQLLVTAPFTDYDSLKDSVQEGKRLMDSGFFTKDNVVMTAAALRDRPGATLSDAIDQLELQRLSASETINQLMKGFEAQGDHSNIYTKYTLIKQVEKLVSPVTPALIEQLLASRSLGEFRKALEDIMRDSPRQQSVSDAAKAFIHEHFAEDIAIDDIADNVFLNSNYLSTIFKRETGTTLVAYLTEYRMERARQLLKDTLMKCSEVARQVGYKNPSYFNMIFKNFYGCTPTAYRKGAS